MTETQQTNPLSQVDDVMRKNGFGKEPGEGVAAILRMAAAQMGVPTSEFTKLAQPQPAQTAQQSGAEQYKPDDEADAKGKHARSRL